MRLRSTFEKGIRAAMLTAALAAGGAACDNSLEPSERYLFQGSLGGEQWTGDASASLTPGDTLYLFGASPVGAQSMPATVIRITVPFRGVGTYPLGARAAAVSYLVGGDVLTHEYETTAAGAGTLTVTSHEDGEITGTVTFDAPVKRFYSSPPLGQTARFQGEFRARIERNP
jgi:hypothetical protein